MPESKPKRDRRERAANPGRREAFKTIGGLLLSGGVSVSIISSIANRQRAVDEWVTIGPVADLPAGETLQRTVSVTEHGSWLSRRVEKLIWLRRNGDGSILVLTGTCPHRSCISVWRPENRDFFCGCHKSQFDLNGKALMGPAARAMDSFEHRVDNGVLLVRCQNFKEKIPTKEAFSL